MFAKLLGFASFGFPKSHAAAFALLAYQSAWLRHHFPAEFLCALLNAQPMGFYPPSSLVRDAQRRGIEVQPPDLNASDVLCRLEGDAVRVGLAYIKGLGEEPATALMEERHAGGPFRSVQDLAQRAPLERPAPRGARSVGRVRLVRLAADGSSSGGSASFPGRSSAGIVAAPIGSSPSRSSRRRRFPSSRSRSAWERMLADYRTTSLSVGTHPLELLRPHLPAEVVSSADLGELAHKERIAVAGLVVARQRPSTANGVVFMLLEDEHGQVNLIVPPPVYDRYRAAVTRRAAASRTRPLRARRAKPQRRRRRARLAVAVRAPGRQTTPRCDPRFPPRTASDGDDRSARWA